MKSKIVLLLLLFVVVCGYTSCQESIYGKYYNIEDEKAVHYVDLKEDGTFFHYYKKDKIERSHSGKWTQDDNKININNWEEYSYEYLKIISGMSEVKFGAILANQIFWIHGSHLDVTPDGGNSAGYIKEEDVAEVIANRKERKERTERFLKDKDTFYYPSSKIIKAIGIEERDFHGEKVKNYDWKHFYATGELESEGEYSLNNKQGIWKYYYKNGQLNALGAFQDSLKVGPWEYYHDNGKLKEKGIYIYIEKGGIDEISRNSSSKYYLTKKRGIWSYYDTSGKFIRTKEFLSREKAYDSLYLTWSKNKDKVDVISQREERIKEEDKYYNDYQASLNTKK
jgi:antitoxin component YwqK of YwqJK toxin-antitoxin module